jgi:hypothetical protein
VRLGHIFDLQIRWALKDALACISYGFSGGNGKEETPVPIPNTEVKLFCADGTARATAWESRSLPEFSKRLSFVRRAFFVLPWLHIVTTIVSVTEIGWHCLTFRALWA